MVRSCNLDTSFWIFPSVCVLSAWRKARYESPKENMKASNNMVGEQAIDQSLEGKRSDFAGTFITLQLI
jgi:hypothetical protein